MSHRVFLNWKTYLLFFLFAIQVIVGESGVGKTVLFIRYTTNEYPTEYIPTVFDGYSAAVEFSDKRTLNVGLWDTVGTDEYSALRPLSYPDSDVIVLAIKSLSSNYGIHLLTSKWIPELRHYRPNTPIILCCTQIDLRKNADAIKNMKERNEQKKSEQKDESQMERFFTKEEGQDIAKRYNCAAYVECSSITGEGVKHVFDTTLAAAVMPDSIVQTYANKQAAKKKQCVVQ